MTNQEKFIEIMNAAFGAGFTVDNMQLQCSPCGALKKKPEACHKFTCEGCANWWRKEYVEPEENEAGSVRTIACPVCRHANTYSSKEIRKLDCAKSRAYYGIVNIHGIYCSVCGHPIKIIRLP